MKSRNEIYLSLEGDKLYAAVQTFVSTQKIDVTPL